MNKKVMIIIVVAAVAIITVLACSRRRIPLNAGDILPVTTATATNTTAPAGTKTITPTISPTYTATQSSPDLSLYPFEDGTIMNWNFYLGSGITNTANSTDMAYMGSHSLRIDGVFKSAESNGVAVSPPSVSNVVGKVLSVRVYIPSDYTGGGGSLYM